MVFFVVGDANADVSGSLAHFPHEGDDSPLSDLVWTSGGSAANVATALARLGAAARLLVRVGVDPAAEVALGAAAAAGVDLGAVQRDASVATGLCFAAVSPGGERTFFSHRGANVALAMPVDSELRDVAWLHLGAHALLEGQQRETALALVEIAAQRGVPISLDLCLPLVRSAPEVVASLLPRLAVLFANEHERAALTVPAAPRLAVHKLGAAGVRVTGLGEDLRLAPFAVDAKDTTGCGDAFVAGFLLAMARGASLEVAGRFGNALGALTATRSGAAQSLPSRDEVCAFLVERGATRELGVLDEVSS